ncbi:MAG: hypothetical protein AB7F64_07825 [Gammaproteobacteria bacterium]
MFNTAGTSYSFSVDLGEVSTPNGMVKALYFTQGSKGAIQALINRAKNCFIGGDRHGYISVNVDFYRRQFVNNIAHDEAFFPCANRAVELLKQVPLIAEADLDIPAKQGP